MSRMSVASRRFYRAFYEWTLLTLPAEVGAVPGCVHSFHSTAGRYRTPSERKADGKNSSNERFPSDSNEGGVWRAIEAAAPARGDEKNQLTHDAVERPPPKTYDELHESIKRLEKAPAHHARDRAFHTLRPRDGVVRYRTDLGVMLEVGVLESDLKEMQMKYGIRLGKLSMATEAMIQVQDLSAPADIRGQEGAIMISVLISGTYLEVARAYHEVCAFNSHSVTPKAQIQVDQTQVNKSTKPEPKTVGLEGPNWEDAEPRKPTGNMAVKSQDVMRSIELPLREFVVREVEGTSVTIETSVREYQHAKFAYRNLVPRLAGKWKVKISVGEPEQRPVKTHSNVKVLARSLIISGDSNAVMHARSDYFRHIGIREAKRKRPRDFTQPEDDYAEGNIFEIAGHPADSYSFCLTKIVGPNFAMLKGVVYAEMTGELGKNVVRGGLGPKNELLLLGELPHIEEFHQKLQQMIERLCDQHRLEPHELQWSSSPVADVIGKRPTDQTYEIFVHGPQAEKLWAKFMRECVEGYRLYGETVIHVQKTRNSVLYTGATLGAAAALECFRKRLYHLCQALGYSQHEVVTMRRPADPEILEGLVDRVRSALRTLTHPVVLITSGRLDMTRPKASDVSKQSEEYLQGLRGATVSSFNAVTMEPQPVVSFNLKLPSRTWDVIRSRGQFSVHFLASNSRGAAIAETFTHPYEQPHAGFVTLREMGVQVEDPAARGKFPGMLTDKVGGGIEAALQVDLLLHKCIEVEDHVIVVGKVFRCIHLGGSQARLALSYAMRGFRSGAGPITPNHSPAFEWQGDDNDSYEDRAANLIADGEGLDPLQLGEDIDPDVAAGTSSQLPQQEQHSTPDKRLARDPVYRTLLTTKERIRREQASDAHETSGAERKKHNKKLAATQKEAIEPEYSESSVIATPTSSSTPSSPYTQAQRPYSTFARQPLNILGMPCHARRFASTSTTPSTTDLSRVLDPSTAQSTVSDYLSTRDETHKPNGKFDLYVRQRRVTHLLNNQADITRLRELLVRGYKILDNGQEIPLTEAEMSSMNEKIVTLERHMDIVLAINAHRMLREMLDRARYGKIFWRQVPEIERLVEKGMKVLMDVARELRSDFDEKKISGKEFGKVGEKLKWRYEGLEREILRLRSVTEEEGDEVFGDDDD